jgi:hypothetical protein
MTDKQKIGFLYRPEVGDLVEVKLTNSQSKTVFMILSINEFNPANRWNVTILYLSNLLKIEGFIDTTATNLYLLSRIGE